MTSLRRSSKVIDEAAPQVAVGRRWASPDPGFGVAVELSRGDGGDIRDVSGVGDRHAREGFTPEEAPPALDKVEPGGARWDEGVLETRVSGQPVPDRTTAVAREIVGNEIELTLGIGLVECVQERQLAHRVAGGCGLRQDLAGAHAERAVDPHLLQSAVILQRRLDAVATRGPARRWWEVPGGYRAELVDTDDRRPLGGCGVERDDPGPFGTKSRSLLVAHRRVRRQRTPSRRKMRRT
jgi:hypothetical protein